MESQDWVELIRGYANGTFALDRPPPQPRFPSPSPHGKLLDSSPATGAPDTPLCESPGGKAEFGSVEFAEETWRTKGYFPAILNCPHEEERLRVLQRYDLSSVGQIKAIDKISETARDLFDVPLVVVSIVLADREVFVSSSGWDPKEMEETFPRISVDLAESFCPHAMSKAEDDGCFILTNTNEDWRFKENHYTRSGAITFFASANVNLPALAPPGTPPQRFPVGSLCLVDHVPRPQGLTEKERRMLKQFAGFVGRELELGFEIRRSRAIEGQKEYISRLFRSLMVYPSAQADLASSSASQTSVMSSPLADVASHLCKLTNSSFAAVLDLRTFTPPTSPTTFRPSTPAASSVPASPPRTTRPGLQRADTSPSSIYSTGSMPSLNRTSSEITLLDLCRVPPTPAHARGRGPGGFASGRMGEAESAQREEEDLLSRDGQSVEADMADEREWMEKLNSREGLEAVQNALEVWHDTGEAALTLPRLAKSTATLPYPPPSALASILPSDSTAALAIPVFDHSGQPALFVVLGSRQPHFQFEPSDGQFAADVGSIIVGSWLRQRIYEADQAKLSFLSQVSHELRTPLFGIGSQIELIRSMADPSLLKFIEPLLDVAEVCISSLREILDDTLEFSKFNNSTANHVSKTPALTIVDLEALIEDVVKACCSRTMKQNAVRAHGMWSPGSDAERESGDIGLDIILDYHLDKGVLAMIDIGGLKRLLITIAVRDITDTELVDGSAPTQRAIQIDVIDTGKGMDPAFLRDSLGVPFRQEDEFHQGTGLGVSISDSIAKRMGGTLRYVSTLGVGTTATCTIPLDFVLVDEPVTTESPLPPMTRPSQRARAPRILSDELSSMFGSLKLEPTPEEEALRTAKLAAGAVEVALEAQRQLEEQKKNGTTPLASVEERPESVAGTPGGAEPAELKVLVVDDNAIARRILTTFLKVKHISFVEASNGVEAVEQFKAFRPNVVWCDAQMPEMDGLEATEQMRRFESEDVALTRSRIIIISGLSSTLGRHADVLASGQVDRWIVKSGGTLKTLTADIREFEESLRTRSSDGAP
ncbi:hypothetical protein JCM1840_006887 [Sporobolomyces johnsonii]